MNSSEAVRTGSIQMFISGNPPILPSQSVCTPIKLQVALGPKGLQSLKITPYFSEEIQ